MKKLLGIGLLELMLSLAVIAILLIAATKYYQNVQIARHIQVAVDTTQALYSAGASYVEDKGDLNPASGKTLIQSFIDLGLLPSGFVTSENPWGGEEGIVVEKATDYQLKITFKDTVPYQACNNVKAKLENKFFVDTDGVTCPSAGVGSMVIVFKDYKKS